MSEIKEIYSFRIPKKVKKEITEEGENNTKIIKTIEQEDQVKIIFKNPSRSEREEADMIFAIEYGKCVRAGVLTSPLVEKLYDQKEKSGILSEDFATKYLALYERFFEVQTEYTSLELKSNKTTQDKKKSREAAIEFSKIKRELQVLEASRNSLFQNTAETKAQNKTILWLTLFLTYIQEEEKEAQPFFKSKSLDFENAFKEKIQEYDNMLEKSEEFNLAVIDKMAFFISLWYMRKASTKEDFTQLDNDLNQTEESEAKNEKEKVT